MTLPPGARMDFMTGMIPYHHQTVTSIGDYSGVTGSYQRQSPVNPAFTHSCILELRKEKSRDAARSRRGKENYEFYELAKMLPLPPAITSQLDKASIIRLTISYLKLRDFSSHGDPPWARDGQTRGRSMHGMAVDLFEAHQGTHILQSLDGFAFALATDGRFLYISETVSIYLGLSQVEMTGSTIFEYVHQQDHAEVAEHLGLTPSQTQSIPSPASIVSEDGSSRSTTPTPNPDGKGKLDYSGGMSMMVGPSTTYKGLDRAFCVRMKSTLTKRGCHFKSSGYRVVLLLCHMRPQYIFSHTRKSPPSLLGMVGLAIALPPPSVHEVRLESDMFVTRLTFDFKIAHCESRVSDLLEYTSEEITGRSLYLLCHGADINKLRKCHVDLINKGQVMSQYYRIMNKSGGYVWMQTCATVVCNNKNAEEQSIICVNYVLSHAEYDHVVFDSFQLYNHSQVLETEVSNTSYPDVKSPDRDFKSETPIPRPPSSHSKSPGSVSPKSGGGSDHIEHLTHLSTDSSQVNIVLNQHGKDPYDDSRIKADVGYDSSSRGQKRKYAGDNMGKDGAEIGKSKPLNSEPIVGGRKKCPVGIDCTIGINTPPPVGTPVSGGTPAAGGPPKTLVESELSPHSLDTSGTGDSIRWKKMCNGGSSVDAEVRVRDAPLTKMNKDSEPTDFSTDALLNKQRPTIQWIGTHQPSSSLPASTLLRQLYVNRESVIRSNVHVSRAPSYYPEIHGTLPTPPSGDNFSEQFLLGKTGDPFVSLPGYNPSPSVSVVSYPECHSAVTPPSSVSPREKTLTESYETSRHQYNTELSSLKPLVYPVHHASSPLPHLDASQYPISSLSGDQPQFYGHSSPPFHLYHPVVNKMTPTMNYTENLKNGTSWYPSSS